jgi:hypothetical protein
VALAGALYLWLTLPPRAIRQPVPLPPTIVTGAYHVHSVRSDGSGTVAEIAHAASRAGLRFVVLTDHGDGTRAPDPPAYHHGVLCIDAVEITTTDGHVVALGLDGPAPYPLAGEARDVIADIHRLGGHAVAAHPDSAREQLSWRAWDASYDGIEWLNADSEWRDDGVLRVAGVAARALVRGPESIALLFRRPSATLARWDRDTAARPVFAVGAVDAHARGPWNTEEPRRSAGIAVPGYETMFRTVVQAVRLDAPLTDDAAADAARVLAALVHGQSYTTVAALAEPAPVEFTVAHDGVEARIGGHLDAAPGQAAFRAATPMTSARIRLLRNGQTLAEGTGSISHAAVAEPGAYRVEAYVGSHDVPWIVTNPIYIGIVPARAAGTSDRPTPSAPGGPDLQTRADDPPALTVSGPWRTERDDTSVATVTQTSATVALDFTLGAGEPAGQYAAAVVDVPDSPAVTEIVMRARADRPMRVAVQLRLPGETTHRWQRSIYLDPTERTVRIPLADFSPVEAAAQRLDAAPIHSVLLVVDTLNHRPGARGRVDVLSLGLR